MIRHAPARRLVVRLHPAEPRGKYDDLFARVGPAIDVRVSERATLLEDIAAVPIVIGIESMALVIAVLCGKKAISVFPDARGRCSLPFPEIVKLKDGEGLADFL
jgi:hypothetical protein